MRLCCAQYGTRVEQADLFDLLPVLRRRGPRSSIAAIASAIDAALPDRLAHPVRRFYGNPRRSNPVPPDYRDALKRDYSTCQGGPRTPSDWLANPSAQELCGNHSYMFPRLCERRTSAIAKGPLRRLVSDRLATQYKST